MSEIKFSKDEMEQIVSRIKQYFNDELDQDIGGFEAEFLTDFFAKEIGPHFYNQGLADALALFNEKSEEISYSIQEMEQQTR
ncbi:DUF2164 domain-containing protein [Oceanospirillum sediminis]|uniref:DUF2164 domain-containing protein n=1 Tax=Oceanospirillum sediminis TaxID=2760088 RepID=A0A839IUU8_9GAMM|nr:DUF2164 domain-containing protein [Oceanospirillum sediminis]MBB1488731.1 DUF2164 domain-containing protein [Oceanospirillum sediminis]